MKPGDLDAERNKDPHGLNKAIIELEYGEQWDEVDIPEELINCASGDSDPDEYGVDPGRYDWKKWEGNRRLADALLARK
jgi:hypothetical protein